MLDKLKNLLGKKGKTVATEEPVANIKPEQPREKKPRKPRAKKELTPKELATKKKKPWYDFKVVVDPENPGQGYFEGDYNRFHVDKLRAAGFAGKTEEEVIAAWLRSICVSVAQEDEQMLDYLASNRVKSQRKDDGTVEYS
jgi:hypothetical protein